MENDYGYHMLNQSVLNDHATILACKYGDAELSESCNLFSNTFSSAGVGYTFNAQPFWKMFRNTTSNFAFLPEVYEQEAGIN